MAIPEEDVSRFAARDGNKPSAAEMGFGVNKPSAADGKPKESTQDKNKNTKLGIKDHLKNGNFVSHDQFDHGLFLIKLFTYIVFIMVTILLLVFFLSVALWDLDYRLSSAFYNYYITAITKYIGTYGGMALTLSLSLLIISGNLLRISYLILAAVFIADVMVASIIFAPHLVGFLHVINQNLNDNNMLGQALIRFFGLYWLLKDHIIVSLISPITILMANGFYLSYLYQKWWQERPQYNVADCVLVKYPITVNRVAKKTMIELKKKTYLKLQQITETRHKLIAENKRLKIENKKPSIPSIPINTKTSNEFAKKPDVPLNNGLIPFGVDNNNVKKKDLHIDLPATGLNEDANQLIKNMPLADVVAEHEINKKSDQLKSIIQEKRLKKNNGVVNNNEIMLNLGSRFGNEPINIKLEGHKTIMGMTGMGKSKLMLYLIGQMIQYSPNEIQLILMCDKEGLTFKHFLHLPHVLKLSKNKKDFTETVDLVCKEQKKRFQLLNEYAFENIGQYNKLCSPSNRIPYIIFIIDEASYIFSSDNYDKAAIERLTAEISTMRASGIFMIFGAQNPGADVIPKNVRANTPHSIVVPCKNAQMSISACGIAGGESLNSETYEAMVVSPEIRTAGDKVIFNRAFVDEESILELVKQSEAKYGFNEELKKIHTDSLRKRELLNQQREQPIEDIKKIGCTTNETEIKVVDDTLLKASKEIAVIKEPHELQELGDNKSSGNPVVNKEIQKEIKNEDVLSLHLQGFSIRDIATKLGSNFTAIQRKLKDLKEDIKKLKESELKNTDICKKLDIGFKTLIAYYQCSEKLEN